jgi:hypothetical protein
MILYKSSLITLDYDPATDILSLDWPDIQDLFVAAVEQEIQELIKNIKHYDIKKLLLDTSRATVNVDMVQYQAFLEDFGRKLAATRLQKVARIGSSDPVREKLVHDAREVTQISGGLVFKVFKNKAEALNWLME